MKAVVMAGGEGSRLRPLTIGRPKPLVPIGNRSVMGHILMLLRSHGITDVVVTLQYMPTVIQDYFGAGQSLGMNLTYVVEETPLGTAGSVKNAAQYLDETFLVISGDAMTDFDLMAIVQSHRERQAMASLTLYPVANPREYGVIVTDEEGRIVQFLEKPDWGDVISDTVNTGIYVLEPEVLDLIPEGQPYDFASQLFPQMLAQGLSLYGYVAQGYWCDVGNISEYMRANADLLQGKIKLPEPLGKPLWPGVWAGERVEIAPDANIIGPVYLGNEVKIKAGVTVHGPAVIRDYTVIDNYSRLERCVLWRNNYVGESCELRGVIVCRQCSIKTGAVAYEGAVIGDRCILGENCVIYSDVKLWPDKQVEPGAIVRSSLIWGSHARRSLFSRFGVTGVVNVDLTPDFVAKLGSALGAYVEKGQYVAINRDAHRSSRMLKRGLISGLPSAGVHVWDLRNVAVPVARHFVRTDPSTFAGIHVRLSPFDQRVVDIRFMDESGMDLSPSAERAIERYFFREDFRRAYLDEIGRIQYAPDPIGRYVADFFAQVDTQAIREANIQLVVDYSHGLAADTLSQILSHLVSDPIPLNALMDESKLAVLRDQFDRNLRRMAKIVGALNAHLGIKLDVGGEKIFLVDDKGETLDNITAGLLMAELALWSSPDRAVAVPITAPNAFETVAQWHGGRVLRTKTDLPSLMKASTEPDVLLALDTTGNFVFPDFQPVVDGMMATARLLEYLARRGMAISEVVAYLPPFHLRQDRVDCPWELKAAVMRVLNQRYHGPDVETIDGLKLRLSDQEWVHIGPNPEHPFFEIRAEAATPERAAELVLRYHQELEAMIRELGDGEEGSMGAEAEE